MRRKHVAALMMAACLIGGFSLEATANNIQVTNVSLTGLDAASSNILINFDLTWENSWRDGLNWDAAWVFAKWGQPGGATTNWSNCVIMTTGHVAPAGCTITNSDAAGALIYRSANGNGTVNYSVKLRWDYTGVLEMTNNVMVSVHAIEMVYVAQGAFEVGGADTDHWYLYPDTAEPFPINSEAAITIGTTAGNMYAAGARTAGVVSNAHPKGYNAFYCMKYEGSQGQYAAFLNKLPQTWATQRDGYVETRVSRGDRRHTISGSWPAYTASAPDRACNHIQWDDMCAYLDWSGLRPMTEFEYEKACVGPETYGSATRYAWGTLYPTAVPHIIANDGQPNAVLLNPQGGAPYFGGTIDGPLRCGLYAASYVNPTREQAGASYWGIMELTSSLYERVVRSWQEEGWVYDGQHGDGVLTSENDDVPNWPAEANSGRRGGYWAIFPPSGSVSNRGYSDYAPANYPETTGFRGVRTAP